MNHEIPELQGLLCYIYIKQSLSWPTWANNSLVYREHDLSHFEMSFASSDWSRKYFVCIYWGSGASMQEKIRKMHNKDYHLKRLLWVLKHTCIEIWYTYEKDNLKFLSWWGIGKENSSGLFLIFLKQRLWMNLYTVKVKMRITGINC